MVPHLLHPCCGAPTIRIVATPVTLIVAILELDPAEVTRVTVIDGPGTYVWTDTMLWVCQDWIAQYPGERVRVAARTLLSARCKALRGQRGRALLN